jgi:hypothetical protein
MNPTPAVGPPRSMGRTRTAAALLVTSGCLALAAPAYASAASVAVTASPNPAQAGAAVTLTNTGTNNPDPNVTNQLYDYYERNGPNCAPTAADERSRINGGLAGNTIIEPSPNSSFTYQAQFVPNLGVGNYLICAYLYSAPDSAAPDAVSSAQLSVSGRPLASTGRASGVRASGATLHGSINPQGAVTAYSFEYGRTRGYGSHTRSRNSLAGFSQQASATTLHGLKRNTTYHYRIVATNRYGTTRGRDLTLRTRR